MLNNVFNLIKLILIKMNTSRNDINLSNVIDSYESKNTSLYFTNSPPNPHTLPFMGLSTTFSW